VLNFFSGWAPDWLTEAIRSFSFLTHFNAMNRGVIDIKDVFFFGSLIALFLFANAIVVDIKKAG
jgi:ABC-2 type transport system permease protein